MPGPIFISHATTDKADVNGLALALRAAFNDKLRTFNTSSGTSIPPGTTWRERILEAIREAVVVVLWATPSALKSREVAFEIGAAFAYGKSVIPCCVHISPTGLPWSLAELQALSMDSEQGWISLAEEIGNLANFPGGIDTDPLIELARGFEATSEALEVVTLGQSIEFKNSSASDISDLHFEPNPSGDLPSWVAVLKNRTIEPGQSVFVMRRSGEPALSLMVSWRDIGEATHERIFEIAEVEE